MSFLGNIVWLLCGGLLSGLGWLIAGLIWCASIVGIPIGVSYEYKKIVLDARYYFGLTNSYDLESPEGIEFGIIKNNGTGSSEKMHNRYFSVTLGYKL